jgi:membrane protease YdiL (CAAX protease family)
MWAGYLRNLVAIVGISSWALISVFVFGSAIAGAVLFGGIGQLELQVDNSSAIFQMIFSVAVYLFGAAILLIEPYTIRRMTWLQVKKLIGLARLPVLRDIGLGLLAWGVYMLLSTVVVAVIGNYVPWINLDQQQDVGFQTLAGNLDMFYAFLVIVIAAPIIEEIIFRGYLYGSLRPRMPWVLAAIITSALFGIVHGQVNVAIDTFLLSMVLCYLRDKTGSIWSGVFVHALKNAIAFSILFVAPDWVRELLMGM